MVKPTPDDVKDVLSQLSGPQQVVLRSYIASLKEEIKEGETKIRQLQDGDEHAHYHGHEKCTSDHSHAHEHHGEAEKDHDHNHHDEHCDHESHDHGHGHKEAHSHEHEHHEEHHHDEHHDHGHKHAHDEDKDDVPAWKKKALACSGAASDPMAAPFGGSWTTESSLSASKKVDDKMEE